VGSRQAIFSVAGAVRLMTMSRWPILVCFMVVPVQVMAKGFTQQCTDDHIARQEAAVSEGNFVTRRKVSPNQPKVRVSAWA
jgi:hypothetical protein